MIRWDRLKPEVARLIISGASSSLVIECTSSPSQTGNLSGLLASKSIGGDILGAVGLTIGSEVAVAAYCCIIGLGSEINISSPESSDGKSQVFFKLNCSFVTNSRESLISSSQLGVSWLLFINGTVVNKSWKTICNCGNT